MTTQFCYVDFKNTGEPLSDHLLYREEIKQIIKMLSKKVKLTRTPRSESSPASIPEEAGRAMCDAAQTITDSKADYCSIVEV